MNERGRDFPNCEGKNGEEAEGGGEEEGEGARGVEDIDEELAEREGAVEHGEVEGEDEAAGGWRAQEQNQLSITM